MTSIIRAVGIATLACAVWTQPVLAQGGLIDLVPAAEFRDERGVDLVGAVYRHHETLLSIGGGGTRSLDLVLSLTSPGPINGNCFTGASAMIYNGLNSNAYLGVTGVGTAEHTAVLPHQSGKFWIVTSHGGQLPLIVTPIDDYYVTGAYAANHSQFNYVGADGTEAVYSSLHASQNMTNTGMAVNQISFPDGEIWTYRYNEITSSSCGTLSRIRSIVSSRGYALQFDYAADQATSPSLTQASRTLVRVTAYNKANVYCNEALLQSCASVTALGSAVTFAISPLSVTITKPNGETVGLGFTEGSGLNLTSVTRPSGTRTMFYEEWSEQEGPTYRFLSSLTEAGRTWDYGYSPIDSYNATVFVVEPGGATSSYDGGSTNVYRATDALGRQTLYGFYGYARFSARQDPEGNQLYAFYDSRSNLNLVRRIPKPGSGLPNLEATAIFPSSCTATDRRSCNQPTSTTDFNGNTTDYTYDSAHGGVLTVTSPAVNGVRPQTRHTYAQRYAWLSNGSGGYVQATDPIWVRTSTSTCRTSAATGNPASPCATAGDEVLTQYDYGPNSGPNSLLLRGQTVTSTDGGVTTTLRSCYGYDSQGRRISETRPNANLASCRDAPAVPLHPWRLPAGAHRGLWTGFALRLYQRRALRRDEPGDRDDRAGPGRGGRQHLPRRAQQL